MNYVYYSKGNNVIDLPLNNDRYYDALEEVLMLKFGISREQAGLMINDIPELESIIKEDFKDELMDVVEDYAEEYIREQEAEERYDEAVRHRRAI